jgi:gamma-glutamyl hercynylcysteine S-oxide hydrolase
VCRHLAYLGPPRSLEELLLAPSHSLLRQSYAPRDMRGGGTINADGYGVAWYPDGSSEPVRHRRACAMWADDGLAGLARHTRSRAVLAAARSATVGMPVVETAVAPFSAGRWLFSHNGVLPGWPDSVEPLAAELPVRDLITLEAPTDSALLWALLRGRLRGGADAFGATATLVREVVELDPPARLNLLFLDGRQIVGTAWYHALSVIVGDDHVAVASEPWDDDPRWQPVPDRHAVVARIGSAGPEAVVRPLDEKSASRTLSQNGAR